ncbi:MAG: lysophospholipid acyltransferase family protein [Candidatus Dadabacteria bacterium]
MKNTSKGFSTDKNYLILSNHLSYLDIFILFSEFPASFIASVDEVREMFLLGRITALSGGYFVERRNRSTLRTDIDEIADILRCGVNVALFPEGTTSTGERVLPFKTPLISAAEKAGVEVLPVCIKYRRINGEDIGPENRDLVYFHGDMEFFSHVGKLLNVKRIDVEVTILEPLSVSSAGSRKDLSDNVYSVISSEYAGGIIEQDKKAAARE